MKTKRGFALALVLLAVFSLVLSACDTTPAVEEVEEAEETETDEAEEEVAEEEEVEEVEEEEAGADLDTAFATFLGDLEGYGVVTVEALNEELAENPDLFLLDVRGADELEEGGHIEGAILIPLRELAQNLNVLPSFDTPIVVYCGSGHRSTIAMTALEGLGWEDVRSMRGGFSAWMDAGNAYVEGAPAEAEVLDAAAPDAAIVAAVDAALQAIPEGWGNVAAEDLAEELAENSEIILIDVRREEEVTENGYIEGATFIPLESFIDGMAMWPADMDETIVIYCGSGWRSTIAMTIMYTYGYTDVRSLRGGFSAWAEAGGAVAGAMDIASALDEAFINNFLIDLEGYGVVTVEDLNEELAETPDLFLLDVRGAEELEDGGHIEGAILIPLRELAQNLDKLSSFDTPIVVYCRSGHRSTIAMTVLEALGWEDVRSMRGGFSAWMDAGNAYVEGAPAEAEALNAAEPDADLVAAMDAALQAIPEGWGNVDAAALGEELAEVDIVLIDVRRSEEVAENGMIEGSFNAPLEAVIDMRPVWAAGLDPDTPVVFYCGSGWRSTIAMTMAYAYGYTDVRSLRGGFGAWVDAGMPVVEAVAP